MEGSLPQALRHILSNARYYGSETFLLAAELLASFINQEPSLLSTLQDSRLTDVLMHALLIHDVRFSLERAAEYTHCFLILKYTYTLPFIAWSVDS